MDEFRFQQKAPAIQELLNQVVNKSNKHQGDFNANYIIEEGWYDSIVLGCPEGSESDERYFLYHSANGGQVCFSRRNSGKVYQRIGVGHPWVNVSYDNHSLEHATAMSLITYHLGLTLQASDVDEQGTKTPSGYTIDTNTNLIEYYARDIAEVNHFHICVARHISPDSIIDIRCIYRRGSSSDGVSKYKYDSDAYIYVSRSPEEGHGFDQLVSDFIKVKPLGGQHFPFTEEQASRQNLTFLRNSFFLSASTYGRNLMKVNAEVADTYYIHIVGDFSKPLSWFALDKIHIYDSQ